MGARFWIGVIATVVAIGVGVGIALWLAGAALATWGLMGAILFFSALAIGVGWILDRRRGPRLDRI